jgi:hypothetical protein
MMFTIMFIILAQVNCAYALDMMVGTVDTSTNDTYFPDIENLKLGGA